MKHFFHIDMWNKLTSGQIIELNNSALSIFGKNYCQKLRIQNRESDFDISRCNIVGLTADSASWREYCLETFRIGHTELKSLKIFSRFNSFFAFESIEDVHRSSK